MSGCRPRGSTGSPPCRNVTSTKANSPALSASSPEDGAIVHFEAVGQRGADDDRPLTKDALFRIFSMTKPITAVAAMILYEEGLFQLTDPVDKFVPEFAELTVLGEDGVIRPAENKMNMQQLLSHTTGLSYGFNPADAVDRLYNEANLWQSEDLDELTEKIAKIPLKFEPGAPVALQRRGGHHRGRRGAPVGALVRCVPEGATVRSARDGGHVLQRAAREDGSLPAQPHLGSRERKARPARERRLRPVHRRDPVLRRRADWCPRRWTTCASAR